MNNTIEKRPNLEDLNLLKQHADFFNEIVAQHGFTQDDRLRAIEAEIVALPLGEENDEKLSDLMSEYQDFAAQLCTNEKINRGRLFSELAISAKRGDLQMFDEQFNELMYDRRNFEDLTDEQFGKTDMIFEEIKALIQEIIEHNKSLEIVTNATEPTNWELAQALTGVLSITDCAELANMEFDDALGYAITLLYEAGVSDPETLLKNKGILK
ncbi:MAG: hypothetical protein WCP93_01445 [Candidatus Berkelbacteria bacterium]